MQAISFNDLKNKVCVITGGGGVLGSSIALSLGSVGVKTAILDLNKEMAVNTADTIKKETGTESIGIETDVLDRSSLENAKSQINETLGDIDLLINGAGGNSPKATTQKEQMDKSDLENLETTFFGLDIAGFDFVFDLNFKGTLLPSLVFITDMVKKGKGAVLNISSMSAYKPLTKVPAYSAAKTAINSFTEWMAVHMAPIGIRVNAIAPGFFLTNQNRFLLTDEKTGELTARGEKIIRNTPMHKFGQPEDLNGTVLYLLSDISSFVSGVIIPIDGGYNAFSGV
jgi:NAD(P)-dependent dehydrogenase (short-subunit alcohol dehydrogenase family)